MNGATLRVATVTPLTAPMTRETPIAASTPSTNRPSEPSITIAATIDARRTLAPTERSTPRASTTTNWASDANPSTTI